MSAQNTDPMPKLLTAAREQAAAEPNPPGSEAVRGANTLQAPTPNYRVPMWQTAMSWGGVAATGLGGYFAATKNRRILGVGLMIGGALAASGKLIGKRPGYGSFIIPLAAVGGFAAGIAMSKK